MNNELKLLVELQEMDTVIDRLNFDLESLPLKIQEIRDRIKQNQESLDQEKKDLMGLQVKKKEKEIEVATQELKIKKNEMDLNSVKSNEAYRALLTEIETARQIRQDMEDEILGIMVESDRLIAEHKRKEAEAKISQQQLEAEIVKQEQDIVSSTAHRDDQLQKKDLFAAGLPKDLMARYDYIRNKKKSVVIVPIVGETCSGCHTILTQVILNDARKGKALVHCESCYRILFHPDSVQAESPPASSPADAPAPSRS